MVNFNERVYEVVRRIPKGKVTTYKEIGRILNVKAYRAIGNALNKNPYFPEVGCHRVVKLNGEVGKFAFGVDEKVRMLKAEGINIQSRRIVDFEKFFWRWC